MSYIEDNLNTNERIIYTASIHWLIYLKGIFLIVLGSILTYYIIFNGTIFNDTIFNGIKFTFRDGSSVTSNLYSGQLLVGIFIIVFGFLALIKAFLYKISTELAVTNYRVIAKYGLIRRSTTELNRNRIESVLVNQSTIQRLFTSGSVTIQGTGTAKTVLSNIDNPLEFRRHISILSSFEG